MIKFPAILILLLSACILSPAQTREMDEAEDDAFFRIAFNREKQEAIANFMDLSEAEAGLFWPIYNDYENKRHKIGTGMVDLIEKYVARRTSLTDEEADALVKGWQKHKSDLLALREQYYPKVKKALGAKAAAGWFQMEEFIQTYAQVTMMKEVPFVKGQNFQEKRNK